MPGIVVVGTQWGDEGKGKVVYKLAKRAHAVVRYNGGNNAGHTVIDEHGEKVFHVLPAGAAIPDVKCFIAGGVVVHPRSLVDEIDTLEASGISLDGRFFISPNAHVVFPWHILDDQERQKKKSGQGIMIGTTGKGIGPCYKDKAGRDEAFRMGDFKEISEFLRRLEGVYTAKRAEFLWRYPSTDATFPDLEVVRDEYLRARERLLPYLSSTVRPLRDLLDQNKQVVFEAAQGTFLDVDSGTYPYVTSSNTVSSAASLLAKVPPRFISRIVGVMKAYITRVGEGPFPTEMDGETAAFVRATGKEFGATTGRPRRCGWLDGPLARYACLINDCTELVITKLDILGPVGRIKFCTDYLNVGRDLDEEDIWNLAGETPIYQEYGGWPGDLSNCHSRDDFPKPARRFLDNLEGYTGVPIHYISTGGQDREIVASFD